MELWSWNRWPNGWAGCRAKDEPACYFPADKWEAVNDAPGLSRRARTDRLDPSGVVADLR